MHEPLRLFSLRGLPDVELIHGHGGPAVDQALQGINGPIQTRFKHGHLLLRNGFQHVGSRIASWCRTADANFDPNKLGGAKRFDHRFDAVMTAVAAGLLELQPPRLQIEIVVNEDEMFWGERELSQKTFERGPADVHPVQQAGQLDDLGTEPP